MELGFGLIQTGRAQEPLLWGVEVVRGRLETFYKCDGVVWVNAGIGSSQACTHRPKSAGFGVLRFVGEFTWLTTTSSSLASSLGPLEVL